MLRAERCLNAVFDFCICCGCFSCWRTGRELGAGFPCFESPSLLKLRQHPRFYTFKINLSLRNLRERVGFKNFEKTAAMPPKIALCLHIKEDKG